MALKLKDWYKDLLTRTVDLVGDYAGNELFIIDGDSILLDVFSNSQLDFWPGFQLLHAAYLVEKFLHGLYQRKCSFHVVFFDTQADCVIPHACPEERRFRYLCARRLLIEHLQQNLNDESSSHEGLNVHVFNSYRSPEFDDYLSSVRPYFVMCHDGATLGLSKSSPVKTSLRKMMNWFMQKTYNIALISNLEFRDTKVMAMILEGSALDAKLVSADDAQPAAEECVVDNESIANIFAHVPVSEPLTHSELLTVSTISYMFHAGAVGESCIPEARAMLLHCILLRKFRLSDRATDMPEDKGANDFLCKYFRSLYSILKSSPWQGIMEQSKGLCDLGDCIDGRLFHHVLRQIQNPDFWHTLHPSVKKEFYGLLSIVREVVNIDLPDKGSLKPVTPSKVLPRDPHDSAKPLVSVNSTVLPFKHPVFDPHLEPISLDIDYREVEVPPNQSVVFTELKYWNTNKRENRWKIREPIPEYIKVRLQKRNQYFLTDMHRYAASLTNTTGGELHPDTIHVSTASSKKAQKAQKEKSSGKHRVVSMATASLADKQAQKTQSSTRALKDKITEFQLDPSFESRYEKIKLYLMSLSNEKRSVQEPELMVYMVHNLVQIWIKCCKEQKKAESMHIATLIWKTVTELVKIQANVTTEMSICINRVIEALKLPQISLRGHETRKLSFEFVDMGLLDLRIDMTTHEFVLMHAGPYMDRSMASAQDPRVVDFQPDEWQRKVLDQIDAKKSLFVVAPTSAGKTFISFYAMKQILQADDDGVIVYVAPTKPLVNQIAAEIQARFSKTFKYGGKSVWSIYTRDYRINNPTSAQILVTVPQLLQIMLLDPLNAKTWSPRVKRIIFDEVHCIGQSEEGVVWEQLLLLAPCPIIALSATVGNPEKFEDWLSFAQKANEHELSMIKHPHRYSDLRKFVYCPPERFSFNGLAPAFAQLKPLGLDNCPDMSFVHPVISLLDRSRGIPDDLSLEPRDCLSLWKAMKQHQTPEFPVSESLAPPKSSTIRKVDVIEWQQKLKEVLKIWMDDQKSPFVELLEELEKPNEKAKRTPMQVSMHGEENLVEPYEVDEDNLLNTTLPLLCSLHDQGALPAILFNYDRGACEKIAVCLLKQLEEAEAAWKSSSKAWKAKIEGWEEWKKSKEKRFKKESKATKRGAPKDGMTKDEQIRDAASSETSVYESFDPEVLADRFHFANFKKLTHDEFREYAEELTDRGVPQKFIDALKRGIGIHHAGTNRKYRQVCEILFRKGYLSVVVATGTLALGINMPCKTVVFSGDSIYLTALSFRQAAGRAGRRGFDVLGNVVFQGVPRGKLCRLLSSRLPDLNGHFPITTSLVLRLMILLSNSGQSAYAKNAVKSLLSSSRICLGGEEARHTILHHLRFSIEYLRRNNLLDAKGTPLDLAGAVARLHYTENSSFAFHALFSNGYFHSLCKGIKDEPDDTLVEMMLVMSHLFGRFPLAQSVLEAHKSAYKKSSSLVVLPPLPGHARGILQEHNRKTLQIYAGYVSTFVDQHVKTEDSVLPLSHLKCGGNQSAQEVSPGLPMNSPVRVNSAFVALSGHHDGQWKSISELCDMVRSGVWLEKAVVPYVGDFQEQNGTFLNAYLYDFYRHGNQKELIDANRVRRSDLWFHLHDFSIILSAIVKSIEDLLGASSEGVDMDFAQGGEETYQQAVEDAALVTEDQEITTQKVPETPKGGGLPATAKKPKSKIVDSWEDDTSDDSQDGNKEEEVGADDNSEGGGLDSEKHRDESLVNVLRAFTMLASRFDEKFKAIYA